MDELIPLEILCFIDGNTNVARSIDTRGNIARHSKSVSAVAAEYGLQCYIDDVGAGFAVNFTKKPTLHDAWSGYDIDAGYFRLKTFPEVSGLMRCTTPDFLPYVHTGSAIVFDSGFVLLVPVSKEKVEELRGEIVEEPLLPTFSQPMRSPSVSTLKLN